uniref:Reverse transcriptase/retrotransposon-derived protein RNase H-like domain-containing protein n=1 Tax=Manihot esculenta TaxID=3983 RepID=A0A2C9UPQ3_MANES
MIEYLGHVILVQGVAMDSAKVSIVLNSPQPKSVRAVRAFLELTRYYRRFIKGYGMIAQPLTQLLKKESQFKFV